VSYKAALNHFRDQCKKSAENLIVDESTTKNDIINWCCESFESGYVEAKQESQWQQGELDYLYHVIKRHEEVGKTHLDIVHLRTLLKKIFPNYDHPEPPKEGSEGE